MLEFLGKKENFLYKFRSFIALTFPLILFMLSACSNTVNYRTQLTELPADIVLVDLDVLSPTHHKTVPESYRGMLEVCGERLMYLEKEHEKLSRRRKIIRGVLSGIGGAVSIATVLYPVWEDEPDQRVVGTLGAFSATSIGTTFGFLGEDKRLGKLDSDASKIIGAVTSTRTAIAALEKSGFQWTKIQDCQPQLEKCEAECRSGPAHSDCAALGKVAKADCMAKADKIYVEQPICLQGCKKVSLVCRESDFKSKNAYVKSVALFQDEIRRAVELCSASR